MAARATSIIPAASAIRSGRAASARSPASGACETIAINKPVAICGITVNPGDLVLADETGVCFIPRERAAEVLQRAQRNVVAEQARSQDRLGRAGAELFGKAR